MSAVDKGSVTAQYTIERGGVAPEIGPALQQAEKIYIIPNRMKLTAATSCRCPLYPRKRTFAHAIRTSALGHKRTRAMQQIRHYSITSSAMASTPGGIVSLRALAVLRLITSSNVVGWIIGRSVGLAPLKILPVYTPTCCSAAARLGP